MRVLLVSDVCVNLKRIDLWKGCDGRPGGLAEHLWKGVAEPNSNGGRAFGVYFKPAEEYESDNELVKMS